MYTWRVKRVFGTSSRRRRVSPFFPSFIFLPFFLDFLKQKKKKKKKKKEGDAV